MANFRVGQKVVAIEDFEDRDGVTMPKKGPIYTIRDICHNRLGVGLRLHEIRNKPAHYGGGYTEATFAAEYFRPVVERKTDISVFKKMLNPQTEKVRA